MKEHKHVVSEHERTWKWHLSRNIDHERSWTWVFSKISHTANTNERELDRPLWVRTVHFSSNDRSLLKGLTTLAHRNRPLWTLLSLATTLSGQLFSNFKVQFQKKLYLTNNFTITHQFKPSRRYALNSPNVRNIIIYHIQLFWSASISWRESLDF